MDVTKKIAEGVFLAVSVIVIGTVVALAQPGDCVTIQSGALTDTFGNQLGMGFDKFGYNYQAHEFNGTYDSVDRNLDGTYWGDTADYVDDHLSMKWSDSWLANKDCNGDGKLDRGLVDDIVGGVSKGWLTNQVEGDYFDANGDSQHYTYFVKVGWTGPGSPLWEQYTILQEIYNDPAGGFHGPTSKPRLPVLGKTTTGPSRTAITHTSETVPR